MKSYFDSDEFKKLEALKGKTITLVSKTQIGLANRQRTYCAFSIK